MLLPNKTRSLTVIKAKGKDGMSQQGCTHEVELIQDALAGNMGAFSELVSIHRIRVLRVAYGVLGSMDAAEDVAQDTFVKLWQRLPEYRGQGALGTWLYRITVNGAIDVLRKRREEAPLDEGLTARNAPEEIVLQRDQSHFVRQAIAELPLGARSALVLREYEQLSYQEIADVLKIPIGTVMSRLNYARQALRAKLQAGGV
jgi:RNA polymerase sigma-70 factor (ECF subfamily)